MNDIFFVMCVSQTFAGAKVLNFFDIRKYLGDFFVSGQFFSH